MRLHYYFGELCAYMCLMSSKLWRGILMSLFKAVLPHGGQLGKVLLKLIEDKYVLSLAAGLI